MQPLAETVLPQEKADLSNRTSQKLSIHSNQLKDLSNSRRALLNKKSRTKMTDISPPALQRVSSGRMSSPTFCVDDYHWSRQRWHGIDLLLGFGSRGCRSFHRFQNSPEVSLRWGEVKAFGHALRWRSVRLDLYPVYWGCIPMVCITLCYQSPPQRIL